MRRIILTMSTMLVVLSASSVAQEWSGQGGRKTMKFDADKAVIVHELGIVVTDEKGKIAVGSAFTRQDRSGGNVDVAEGDEVGMINGKRIATLAQLREQYEQAPAGSEVRLGIRRNDEARIVTFVKKDPKDAPQKMIVRKSDRAGDEDVLPALGIIIRTEKEQVVIAETLPGVSANFRKGDIIASLNGKAVKRAADFSSEFDATGIGKELRFGIVREGKTVSFTLTRPEPRGNVIITK